MVAQQLLVKFAIFKTSALLVFLFVLFFNKIIKFDIMSTSPHTEQIVLMNRVPLNFPHLSFFFL